MESPIDLETNGARLTLDDFSVRVFGNGRSLVVAKVDQVLVHKDLATVYLIVLLNATEELMRSFLEADSKSVGQVNIDLIAHVFGKNSRKLIESLLELAIFIRVEAVLVVVDIQLAILDLEPEFLLVDVGL